MPYAPDALEVRCTLFTGARLWLAVRTGDPAVALGLAHDHLELCRLDRLELTGTRFQAPPGSPMIAELHRAGPERSA